MMYWGRSANAPKAQFMMRKHQFMAMQGIGNSYAQHNSFKGRGEIADEDASSKAISPHPSASADTFPSRGRLVVRFIGTRIFNNGGNA